MKYMITDDASLGRKMLAKHLKKFINENDDEIIFAENGQVAVDLYKEQEPDVCFMDLTMPVMDGFEATKQIIAINPLAKIFVVSADTQKETIIKIMKAGALRFVDKPIDSEKLTIIFDILKKGK